MKTKIRRNIYLAFCAFNTVLVVTLVSAIPFLINAYFDFLLLSYAVSVAVTILVIIISKIETKQKLLYVVLCVFLPYLGIGISVFMLVFSKRRREADDEKVRLWVDKRGFFEGKEVNAEYFSSAKNWYEDFIENLKNAKREVLIFSYIIEQGFYSTMLFKELYKLLSKGVKVKIATDYFGSGNIKKDDGFLALKKAGAVISVKNKPKLLLLASDNNRVHAKVYIIDGNILYLGSANIDDESIFKDKNCGIKIIADKLNLASAYYPLWNKNAPISPLYGNNSVTALTIEKGFLEKTYLSLLNKASESVKIITPYLSLNDVVYKEVEKAVKRGVKVKIIVPNYKKNGKLDLVSRYHAKKLQDTGVSVFSYKKAFLHSKVILIDDRIALLGSANFDIRSALSATESIIISCENGLIAPLIEDFCETIKNSNVFKVNSKKSDFILNVIYKAVSPLV